MTRSSQALTIPETDQNIYDVVRQQVDLGTAALQRSDADTAITFFQSGLEKLSPDQPFYDHLVHNLLLGYKLLIQQRSEAADHKEAASLAETVLRFDLAGEMGDDTDFQQAFAAVFQEIGLGFFKYRQLDVSVRCYRKAISVHHGPGSFINLTNALAMTRQPAVLSDFTAKITREELGRHLFIACAPKSGSTFLKNLLVTLTGYRDAFMVSSPGQFEQELYLPMLRETAHLDTVTQQHCRGLEINIQLMQAFEIRPVVLVRNIFDSVVSLLDFYDGGAFRHTNFLDHYPSLSREDRVDLLIDNFVPWYFQFVASWSLAQKQERLEVFWLTYEELIANKRDRIRDVLAFYGLGASLRGIQEKVKETESQKRKTRFNKGVAGRGEAGLSDCQKERVRSFARYYPATDFTRLGL